MTRDRYMVVHRDEVCMGSDAPLVHPGQALTNLDHQSVACASCGRSGIWPAEGKEMEVLEAWAERNHYRVTQVGDQYIVHFSLFEEES